jgi:exonuclease V gamma subunit
VEAQTPDYNGVSMMPTNVFRFQQVFVVGGGDGGDNNEDNEDNDDNEEDDNEEDDNEEDDNEKYDRFLQFRILGILNF